MSKRRIWYISEINQAEDLKNTAGVKAREDAERIFFDEGFSALNLRVPERSGMSSLRKVFWHLIIPSHWIRGTGRLKRGDILLCQFPLEDHSVFLSPVFKRLKKRGIRIIALVHDLDIFRTVLPNSGVKGPERLRIRLESRLLRYIDCFIVHNDTMAEIMMQQGFKRKKLISLGIFDYLIPDTDNERLLSKGRERTLPVIIAGSLRAYKAGYVYDLPDNCSFALYGVGYEGTQDDKRKYMGVFTPEELPYALEGSFGLVWDGSSADTCEGVFGDYLRINNPHKTSLYLASGIPVIMWREAALAQFIEKEGCGFTVDSLDEIADRIDAISDEDYRRMKDNARRAGESIRSGEHLKTAIKKALQRVRR